MDKKKSKKLYSTWNVPSHLITSSGTSAQPYTTRHISMGWHTPTPKYKVLDFSEIENSKVGTVLKNIVFSLFSHTEVMKITGKSAYELSTENNWYYDTVQDRFKQRQPV